MNPIRLLAWPLTALAERRHCVILSVLACGCYTVPCQQENTCVPGQVCTPSGRCEPSLPPGVIEWRCDGVAQPPAPECVRVR